MLAQVLEFPLQHQQSTFFKGYERSYCRAFLVPYKYYFFQVEININGLKSGPSTVLLRFMLCASFSILFAKVKLDLKGPQVEIYF